MTLLDAPFRQFDPIISCPSFTTRLLVHLPVLSSFCTRKSEDDKMYLLVPAHPGCPGQSPESCKMVKCVCVWLWSFKSLAHSFCFFPFAKEITLFAFCLLFLYSFHASVNFFFQFPYFFFFSLTASATHSTTMFPGWAFWQSTYDLCSIHYYVILSHICYWNFLWLFSVGNQC